MDFLNDDAWAALCDEISAEVRTKGGDFQAQVVPISDKALADDSIEALRDLALGAERTFFFIADHDSFTHPERPILAVDITRDPMRMFRFIPSEAWGVENNLRIANMDFDEFADAVDQDGIFRGFR
jgi:hypothetical protein